MEPFPLGLEQRLPVPDHRLMNPKSLVLPPDGVLFFDHQSPLE
jgi:hypothetical protein